MKAKVFIDRTKSYISKNFEVGSLITSKNTHDIYLIVSIDFCKKITSIYAIVYGYFYERNVKEMDSDYTLFEGSVTLQQ